MAVDRSRAKISRRNRPNLDQALQSRAQGITAEDIENPTKVAEETSNEEQAEPQAEVTQPEVETKQASEPEPAEQVSEPEAPKQQDSGEDDWIDSLTVPQHEEQPQQTQQQPQQPAPQESYQEPMVEAKSEAEIEREEELERQRLERMRNMSTVDEAVAKELYETLVKPEVEYIRKQYDDQVSRLSGSVSEQQKRQQEIERRNQLQLRTETNSRIMERYPKADRILQSAEFAEFLNSRQDPYSPVSKYDILNKAYNAGDAEYVLRELDAFAETRRKPKPQASVDTNSGGTPNTGGSGRTKVMTESEYMAKRKKIMSRRHNPSELTKLYNQFRASQQQKR